MIFLYVKNFTITTHQKKVYYVKNRYNPIFLSISNDEKPTVISKANLMDHIESYRTKEDFSIANPPLEINYYPFYYEKRYNKID